MTWPSQESSGAAPARPLLYLTFGSVAPQIGHFPDLYRGAIDALATLPARVLVTVGNTTTRSSSVRCPPTSTPPAGCRRRT